MNEEIGRISNQYILIKEFESDHLMKDFWSCLETGFSSETNNYLFTCLDYLRYKLIPFLINIPKLHDLCSMGVVKNDVSIILYELFRVLESKDRNHPNLIRNELIRCYLSIKEVHSDPVLVLKKLSVYPLLTMEQIELINSELLLTNAILTPELAGYVVEREPYFRFKYIEY